MLKFVKELDGFLSLFLLGYFPHFLLFHAFDDFQLPFLLDSLLIEILQPHHIFDLLVEIFVDGLELISLLILP